MRKNIARRLLVIAASALLVGAVEAQKPILKVVVLEGEGAVNVMASRTAVAPVVEVRDANDQPVAGAVVRFAIRSGRATFNGARTISVTTGASGRAAAAGLLPTGNGALQITATATFQGQTAAVAIAQTNVVAAVQVTGGAAAGGAGGSGAASGGTAAGSTGAGAGSAGTAGTAAGGAGAGGGLSATTIAVAGAAAVGGTVIAEKTLGDGGGTLYSGPFAVAFDVLVVNVSNGGSPCTYHNSFDGSVSARLKTENGALSGEGAFDYTMAGGLPSTCNPPPTGSVVHGDPDELPVTGSPDNFSFTFHNDFTSNGIHGIRDITFSGALRDGVVTGVVTITYTESNGVRTGSGSASVPATLQPQP